MTPELPNETIKSLVQEFSDRAERIAKLLRDLLLLPVARRFSVYRELVSEVAALRRFSREWATESLVEFFSEEDRRVSRKGSRPISAQAGAAPVALGFLDSIDKALFSLSTLGGRLLRSTDPIDAMGFSARSKVSREVAKGVSPEVARTRALNSYLDEIAKTPVTILGKSAKPITFSLPYYVALSAQVAMVSSQTAAAKARAQSDGMDLVRVTDNPSLIGDYCDAYRGRVFSVSGTHPKYPPLASTPSGGPPFHPWCTHTLTPVTDGEASGLENALVDSEFLLEPGESAKRVDELWQRRNEKNPAKKPRR